MLKHILISPRTKTLFPSPFPLQHQVTRQDPGTVPPLCRTEHTYYPIPGSGFLRKVSFYSALFIPQPARLLQGKNGKTRILQLPVPALVRSSCSPLRS
jgi:hypothetical protein